MANGLRRDKPRGPAPQPIPEPEVPVPFGVPYERAGDIPLMNLLTGDPLAWSRVTATMGRGAQRVAPGVSAALPSLGELTVGLTGPLAPAVVSRSHLSALDAARSAAYAERTKTEGKEFKRQLPAYPLALLAAGSRGPARLGSWSKTTTRGPKPKPGYMESIGKSAEAMKAAEQLKTDVGIDYAEEEAEAYGDVRGEMSELQRRKQAKVDKLLAQREQEMLKYRQAREMAAQETVDPDGWWSNRTTGQKTMAMIGVALGAFGEGFTGGRVRNAAMQIIDREIDRDLKSQMENLRKGRADRAEQLGVIGLLSSQIKDEEALYQNGRIMLLDNLSMRMKEKASQLQNRKLAAEMAMTAATIDQKARATENKLYMASQPTTRTTSSSRQVATQGGGGFSGKQLKPKFISEWSDTLGTIEKMRDLVRRIRGTKLTPTREALAVFGTDAGRLMPEIRQLARMLGRTVDRADVGNLAISEAHAMVKALTGGEWNKARVTAQNLQKRINMALEVMRDKVIRLDAAGNNVAPIAMGLFRMPGQQQPVKQPSKAEQQQQFLGERL